MTRSENSDANATYATSYEFHEDEAASTEAPGTDDYMEELENCMDDWDIDDDEWVIGPSVHSSSSSSDSVAEIDSPVPPAGGRMESQNESNCLPVIDDVEEVGDDENEMVVQRKKHPVDGDDDDN